MALGDLLADIFGPLPGWLLPVGVVLSLISVKKLELAPWRWLADWCRRKAESLGRFLCAAVIQELSGIRQDLDAHIREADQREASRIRERLLVFSAQLGRGWRHTEEMYVDILLDIDWYEEFCQNHSDYHNSRATAAIHHIRADYQRRLTTHDFA